MGCRPHFLTPYVVVLHAAKKANKSNKYAKYSSQQIAKLLDDAAKDGAKSKPFKKRCRTESSDDGSSDDDDNDNPILEEETSNLDEITLDNYIFRPLTIIQEQKLEQLLLDVTVSFGEQAVAIASFFNRAKVWIGKLREEQAAMYKNKYYALINLATKIEEQESDDLYDFPNEYLNCISDNNWWKKLKELETLVLPYCAALNQLQ
ncbi:unnamed protein product [Rhizophagus irregularis]|nr:unnamed protein product [Rhizophagus irregularis]